MLRHAALCLVATAVLFVCALGSPTVVSTTEGYTYKEAASKCKAKGLTICLSAQLCSKGKPIGKSMSKSKQEQW